MNLPVTRSPLAICRLVVATAALYWPVAAVRAAGPEFSPQQVDFFEVKVRPVLAGTCQKCHGGANHKGGLRLDSRESVLKGGDSGAAVVPGNPNASPMIDAVNYRGLEMPPTG
ncbi:MAG TPA: c-type cytochrome domain-containing protein, partial [Planctomycetaceae bacterium]|nr:c-type cytochrome domain-containing protein [Planctomycetaceae bacterium]